MQTRAQVSADPGDHADRGRRGQSRASLTPIWRLGVQCERLIRDST